jgi:hypothetical protein
MTNDVFVGEYVFKENKKYVKTLSRLYETFNVY